MHGAGHNHSVWHPPPPEFAHYHETLGNRKPQMKYLLFDGNKQIGFFETEGELEADNPLMPVIEAVDTDATFTFWIGEAKWTGVSVRSAPK